MWYGLKVDGELVAAMLWRGAGEPTLFDFEMTSWGRHYEIVEVEVREVR